MKFQEELTSYLIISVTMNSHNRNLERTVDGFVARDKLSIIALNCNSIYSNERRDSLNDFILEHKPDIFLLSETKLDQNCNCEFENYTTVRNDRPTTQGRNSGGTATLIKQQYTHTHINIPKITDFKHLGTTIILIKIPRNKNLYIISAYVSTTDSAEFTVEINSIFHTLHLHRPNNYYILAGDLNARHRNWLNSVNNSRGITTNSWLENNYTLFRCKLYHTSIPTFHRDTNSYIDLAIADGRIKFNRFPTPKSNNDQFGLLGLQQVVIMMLSK